MHFDCVYHVQWNMAKIALNNQCRTSDYNIFLWQYFFYNRHVRSLLEDILCVPVDFW